MASDIKKPSIPSFFPLEDVGPEFISLLSPEEEEEMNNEKTPSELPILPLKTTALFPVVVIPTTVGRHKSIKLISDDYKGDKIIGIVAQKDETVEYPGAEELHSVGTIAFIIKMLKMPDGNTMAIIQGK